MVNYMIIAISSTIFIFYLITILMLFEIKRKLDNKLGTAFIYMIIAVFFLLIRRLQQIFLETARIDTIPYFTDIVTLIFALVFFIAIFSFYRNIRKIAGSRRSTRGHFQKHKKKPWKKILKIKLR